MSAIALSTPTTTKKIWTDAELMALTDGKCYELVDGELIDMGNSGALHGYTCSLLVMALMNYILPRGLGIILDSSTAFTMKNGNKRSPDISFVSKERLTGLKRLPQGFFDGAPDLVVEIISPGNTFEEIHTKVEEYFASGTRLLWIIHPDEKFVLVYHSPQPDRLLRGDDILDGEDVIPNFKVALSDLFRTLDF